MKSIFLLSGLFLIAAFGVISCSGSDEEPIVNTPTPNPTDPGNDLEDAPSFSLETTSGDALKSSQFKDKNLVIFFFGFNCGPCRAVGPDVESMLHQQFKSNDDFAIIGADQWEGNDAGVDDFQKNTGITFPLGRKGASMANDFGTTYDRLVIINKENKIVFRGNSIVHNHLEEAIEVIQDLLNS